MQMHVIDGKGKDVIELKEIGRLICENIQWIFSGIGVAVLSFLGGKEIIKKIKTKQITKGHGVNISSANDIQTECINTQTSGDNSNNFFVQGDYHAGLSFNDARQVALDVFKANTYIFTDIARQTIDDRATEITDDIFTMIYNELPDRIGQLVEPAVQEALLKVQKAYAKNNSPNLKEQLILLLKNRLSIDKNDMEQIILDEALEIIPKLSSEQMNILSLHLSVLRLNHSEINNRESFFSVLKSKVMPFYTSGIEKTMSYDHLRYLGCTGILSEGSTYKPLEEIYKNRYGGLFSKGFDKTEFDNYMGMDTTIFKSLLTICQLDNQKYQFNAMNEDVLESQIIDTGNIKYKDKLMNFYRQGVMSPEEIKRDIAESVSGFNGLSDVWKENREIKAMNLTSVGIAIGILNYNINTGSKVELNDFLG